jgi:hypothetical protein
MNELVIPPMRTVIFAIEAEMKKHPQIDIPVKHYFSHGIYAREVTVPEGSLITGVIYKWPQINILSKGIIRVSIGEEIREICASYTVVSPPGVKRIAYTLTEVIWTTILQTFLTDIDAIEKEFFAHSEQEYSEFVRQQADYKWLE